MSDRNGRSDIQGLFGALLGGLLSCFVGSMLAVAFMRTDGSSPSWALTVSVGVGLACAIGFMAGGLLVPERLRWLSSALLFGSGFTTIWSVAMSLGSESRWVTPVALGIAIVTAVAMGLRRFAPKPAESGGGIEAAGAVEIAPER